MPRARLPHLHRQSGRKGQPVWYFRVGHGPRERLPGDYGSEAFMARYKALMASAFMGAAPAPKAKPRADFTVRWLFDEYRKGGAWTGLKPSTRTQRDRLLGHIVSEVGDDDAANFDQAAIVAALEKRRGQPHQANHLLKTLRHVFDWALEQKKVDRNPCAGVKPFKVMSDDDDAVEGHPPWSEEDIARFKARWPLGTRERTMFSIFLCTGLRIGDAARLGRFHLQKDGTLQIRAEKNRATVILPIYPELHEAIEASPASDDAAFITGPHGRAYTKESLGNMFRDAVRAAGLVDRSAHGLRKTCAMRLAEKGASEKMLNDLFGWRDPRMAQFYVNGADKSKTAKLALALVEGSKEERSIPSHAQM